MSKMREAFEALYVSMPANIKPDSNEWHAELMCRVFAAGYQAAIAAVKERDRVIIWRCKLCGGEAVRCIPLLEELPED